MCGYVTMRIYIKCSTDGSEIKRGYCITNKVTTSLYCNYNCMFTSRRQTSESYSLHVLLDINPYISDNTFQFVIATVLACFAQLANSSVS